MPNTISTKTRILDKATQVFYENGYKSTVMDMIAKAVGITKATLYHHFESKDQLIEESLKYLSAFHRGNYTKAWSKANLTPLSKLTILFDEMDDFFKSADCYGCPFINAASEFKDRDHPVRKICEDHYEFVTTNLENFAQQAELTEPRIVAEQITECIIGAYSSWLVTGAENAAHEGKNIANLIIANHVLKNKE